MWNCSMSTAVPKSEKEKDLCGRREWYSLLDIRRRGGGYWVLYYGTRLSHQKQSLSAFTGVRTTIPSILSPVLSQYYSIRYTAAEPLSTHSTAHRKQCRLCPHVYVRGTYIYEYVHTYFQVLAMCTHTYHVFVKVKCMKEVQSLFPMLSVYDVLCLSFALLSLSLSELHKLSPPLVGLFFPSSV